MTRRGDEHQHRKILTDVAGRNLDHGVRLVAQNYFVAVRVDWRPSGEEDGILEHGLDPLLPEPSLFVEKKRGSHRRALRIADDAVERAALLHDLEQVLERVVGAPVRRRDALSHQLPHGVLGRLTLRKVSNSRENVVFLAFLQVVVRLDEAEIRRLAKVLLKPLRRDCLAGPMDEVEGSSPIFSQFLDKRCLDGVSTGSPAADFDLRADKNAPNCT
jgi:hypothetical protein